jgi:tRNA-2-methylthio-N6-dimethylallyladenosine synthase
MRTYFIETWGCQMNHHDSEHLEGQLRESGLEPADHVSRADLVLLNTCSVREKPVHKLLSRIGSLSMEPQPPLIGVCGCVAEQVGEALMKQSKSVAFVLGPGQITRVGDAVRAVSQGERPVLTGFGADLDSDFQTVFRKSSTRAMVTVVEGCDEFCTFCVVPYTRGRERSRPMEDVLTEARAVAEGGLREVELLGQTINAYKCPDTGADFADLLDGVAAIPSLKRIRYITSHPRHFGERLIRVLARHDTVSRYLHLPFQAGSDTILRAMRRRYTRREYIDLIARIRDAVPDINVSTDVIVGFPGETEEDFQHSLDVLERLRFGQVFAFGFSPRPGTPAARYPEQVEEEVKKDRLHRLFAVADRISLELNQSLVGTKMPVLIDGVSRRREEDWQGRGEDNRVVNFPKGPDEGIGDVVDVRILRAGPHSLSGERAGKLVELPVLSP